MKVLTFQRWHSRMFWTLGVTSVSGPYGGVIVRGYLPFTILEWWLVFIERRMMQSPELPHEEGERDDA